MKFDDKKGAVYYVAQLLKVKKGKKEMEVNCYLSTLFETLTAASKRCFKKYHNVETIEVDQIVDEIGKPDEFLSRGRVLYHQKVKFDVR